LEKLLNIEFEDKDWLLKHQIFALLTISLFFGLGVLLFAYFRFKEGNIVVAISQLFLGLFMVSGFFVVRERTNLYQIYSILFMILFYIYSFIIFFYVPQNTLNILWIVSAPILIFFFLNRVGGTIMFILIFAFLCYLVLSEYPYSLAEYVTLFAAFLITTFVMYINENVKEAEKNRLINYNAKLQKSIEQKTKSLKLLNAKLEERVKEELNKRLEHEQLMLRQCKLASMGEMIDSIAHQWRQPLMNINAILLNIDRASSGDNRDYLEHKIDEISNITSYMSQTIEDFRSLLKPNKNIVKFELNSMLNEVQQLMSSSLRDIKFTIDIQESIEIKSYKNELIQALIIFITNAKEALYARDIKNKKIEIVVRKIDNKVVIDIKDNAGGIDSKHINHIFAPYYTTKEQTGGTGLGLYIAKLIIEHNIDGKLEVKNIKDGANFTMTLPISLHSVTL